MILKKILIVAGLLDSGDIPLIIKENLVKLNYICEFLPVDENLPYKERYLHKIGRRYSWINLFLFSQRLYKKISIFQPNLLFVYGSNWSILPQTLGKIKRNLGCKIILWEGNLQFWRWFQGELLRYYDYIFVNDSYALPLLKGPAQLKNVIHFPGCICDPDIHKPLELSEEERNHYGSDIGFIGMGHPDRIEFFEKLTEFSLKLWGKQWDKSDKLKKYFVNEPVGLNEKIKIYQATKININIQSNKYQIDGISAKIFEIAGCSGFFLTEKKKDLSLFFKDEEDLISFNSIDDLKEKINHYLSNPQERISLSNKIREKVITNYTYKIKLKEMMNYVLE